MQIDAKICIMYRAQVCKLYAANMQSYANYKCLYIYIYIYIYAIIWISSYAIICILYAYTSIYMHPLHIYDYVRIMHVSAYICTAATAHF